jgi:carbamoyltransferase
VRAVGLDGVGVPREALAAVLGAAGRTEREVSRYVTAERGVSLGSPAAQTTSLHHFAHAATAALTSGVQSATVLICDTDPSPVTVWDFDGEQLVRQDWPHYEKGFAEVYSECAQTFGFGPDGEHRLEGLARIGNPEDCPLFCTGGDPSDPLGLPPDWMAQLTAWLAVGNGSPPLQRRASAAAAFQQRLGDTLVAIAAELRRSLPRNTLCVGGGLFYNTYLTTRLATAGLFESVCVPLNPGNAGVAAGAAIAYSRPERLQAQRVSPFLGPEYTEQEIKATLDNCKLTYEYVSQREVVELAVRALARGLLVGWFQGRMEWGHRALGHRSILASPFSPHVLENLNGYLKQREPYRAYGLSVCEGESGRYFVVPALSPHMELEYAPQDPVLFRHILPPGARTLRVQTVRPGDALFHTLHRAFGDATGSGVLVNTSFNGLHEPMVCSPRDAVRVFYGTGLDLLVMGQFIVRK